VSSETTGGITSSNHINIVGKLSIVEIVHATWRLDRDYIDDIA